MFKDFILVVASALFSAAFMVVMVFDDRTPKPVEKTVTVTKVVTNPGLPDRYRVFHDAERGVTCYYKEDSNGAGGMAIALSCVPDTQLRPKL